MLVQLLPNRPPCSTFILMDHTYRITYKTWVRHQVKKMLQTMSTVLERLTLIWIMAPRIPVSLMMNLKQISWKSMIGAHFSTKKSSIGPIRSLLKDHKLCKRIILRSQKWNEYRYTLIDTKKKIEKSLSTSKFSINRFRISIHTLEMITQMTAPPTMTWKKLICIRKCIFSVISRLRKLSDEHGSLKWTLSMK